jgi:hypothetical protein
VAAGLVDVGAAFDASATQGDRRIDYAFHGHRACAVRSTHVSRGDIRERPQRASHRSRSRVCQRPLSYFRFTHSASTIKHFLCMYDEHFVATLAAR